MNGSKRPPNPDPDNYIWVTTREGSFWRRKRGTVKKATLNAQFSLSSEYTKVSSPAASRIVNKLKPWLDRLKTGRLTAKISGYLQKALHANNRLDFSFLNGFDLQKEHPLEHLLIAQPLVKQDDKELAVYIDIDSHTIKRHSQLVTNYYFELLLLYGDAGRDNGLRTEYESSNTYAIGETKKEACRLAVPLPSHPWLALLKVSCIEGNEMAASARNYGMKVIAVGGG